MDTFNWLSSSAMRIKDNVAKCGKKTSHLHWTKHLRCDTLPVGFIEYLFKWYKNSCWLKSSIAIRNAMACKRFAPKLKTCPCYAWYQKNRQSELWQSPRKLIIELMQFLTPRKHHAPKDTNDSLYGRTNTSSNLWCMDAFFISDQSAGGGEGATFMPTTN